MVFLFRTLLVAVLGACCLVFMAVKPAAAQSDTAPPMIIGMHITPTVVDTQLQSQVVTFTVRITDDLSGLEYLTIWFGPLLIDHDQDKSITFREDDLQGGTTVDGVYRNSLTLPRYSAAGRWVAKYMVAVDAVGNQAYCQVNWQEECPDGWGLFYFVNVRDDRFLYLPALAR